LKDQLKLLIELQVYDAKIQELDGALKAFPAKFEAMNADVKKVETMLDRERAQLAETESWRKKQEQDANDQEDALIKARQRSGLVKNVKEHMANERELETNRKNAQSREEEVKRLAGAVETAKKSLVQHEADLAAMKSHVSDDELSARAQMTDVEQQIATIQKDREVAAARVDAAALKRYSSIRMRRGMALAAVRNSTCLGCHMNIPPQLFNILQRGNSIETCPNCNRIIYWDRMLMDPAAQAADQRSAAAALAKKVEKAPKAKRAAKSAAPQLPATPPPPDAKREQRGQLAAPSGSEPGAAGIVSADTLRSSSHGAPDTATGPSTDDSDPDSTDDDADPAAAEHV